MKEIEGLLVEEIEGKKRPIIFIHSLWGGSWMFENWMQYASSVGHHVFAINLRGHWGSRPCNLGKVGIDDYVSDVLALIGELQFMDNPVLVGHSMGGLITQIIASRYYGFIKKAVLVNTAPPGEVLMWGPMVWQFAKNFSYWWPIIAGEQITISRKDMVALGVMSDLDDEIYKKIVPESGKVVRQIAFGRKSVPNLSCESMMLIGLDDRVCTPTMQIKVADHFGIYRQTYPDMGHLMMLEKGWEKPIQDILDYVG